MLDALCCRQYLFLLVLSAGASRATAAEPRVIPTEFEQFRFYAVPRTAGGDVMRLLVDTGGGSFMFHDAATRLKLDVANVNNEYYRGAAIKLPPLDPAGSIPAPQTKDEWIPAVVSPIRARLSWITPDLDGVLGETWFAHRVWVLDYPNRRLTLYPGDPPSVSKAARRLDMGFHVNERGEQNLSYPRITVTIAGHELDVLLASGSTVAVNPDALKVIDPGGPAIRATSLISAAWFARWRDEHPDWPVVTNAEQGTGEPMIEVPELTIAGFSVGPAWFTQRSNENFRDLISDWTDKPVEGAIGGNVLRHFRVTLDYPRAAAWLEKP